MVLVRGATVAVGRVNSFGTWEEAICDDARRCIKRGVVNHLDLGADPALVTQTPSSSVLPIDFGRGRNGLILRVRRALTATPVDPFAFFRALPGIGRLIPSIGTAGGRASRGHPPRERQRAMRAGTEAARQRAARSC
jgi:hypothetical protein